MQTENVDEQKRGLSNLTDEVMSFGQNIHQNDEVLLSQYSFAWKDRLLTTNEAKSFLAFVRNKLSSK